MGPHSARLKGVGHPKRLCHNSPMIPLTPTPPSRGLLLDRDSLGHDLSLERLYATLPEWQVYAGTEADELHTRLAEAQVVVSNKVVLDAAAIAAAPALRLIAVAATGYNNIDLAAAKRHGIAVCNVRHYAGHTVVEHTLALLLTLVRNLDHYRADVAQGAWDTSDQFCLLSHPIRELNELTLGVVGHGDLGARMAHTAQTAFGMRVRVAARPGQPAQAGRIPLAELLPQVDVLTLHCPLSEETRNLIGAAELAAMRRGSILLNTARGGLVDEAALAAALRSGHLGGAGVDVLVEEPPRHGSPLIAPDIPNLILTPHIAWAARGARQRLLDQVAENIQAFVAGAPRNLL